MPLQESSNLSISRQSHHHTNEERSGSPEAPNELDELALVARPSGELGALGGTTTAILDSEETLPVTGSHLLVVGQG